MRRATTKRHKVLCLFVVNLPQDQLSKTTRPTNRPSLISLITPLTSANLRVSILHLTLPSAAICNTSRRSCRVPTAEATILYSPDTSATVETLIGSGDIPTTERVPPRLNDRSAVS